MKKRRCLTAIMGLICLLVLGPDRFMLPALLITSGILFVSRTGEVQKS